MSNIITKNKDRNEVNADTVRSLFSGSHQPISRRGLLTGLLGTAGAALSASTLQGAVGRGPGPRRGGGLGDDSEQGIIRWKQPAITPELNIQSATHFNGSAYAVLNNVGGAAYFYCFSPFADYQQIFHKDRIYFRDLVKMPAIGSIVMLTNNATVDGYGPSSNPWSITLDHTCDSNLVVVNGNTIVGLTTDRCLSAYTLDGNGGSKLAWKSNQLPLDAYSAVYLQAVSDNSFLLLQPSNDGLSQAYYMNTQDLIVPQFEVEFATGPFIAAPPYFYCLANDYSNWSITQNSINNDSTFTPWPRATVAPSAYTLVGDPILYNGSVYVPCGDDSTIRSVDVNTGALGTPVTAPAAFGRNMVIENGAAYYALPGGTAYGIDLASGGAKQVSYAFPTVNETSAVFMCGVENGMAVVIDNDGIMNGLDLAAELRAYSCDSVLMAEDYVAGGSGAQPANPGYRTTLQLLDGNGNPRAKTGVRIEASDTVTIVSGGVTTALANGGDAVWLTTDASGNLDFVSVATDIQSPALHIWAAFMNQNESIVIYPDHQAISKLAGKAGSDYANATGFDGQSALTDGVSGDDVAKAVQNTLGTFALPPASNPYSAFPATASNILYQAQKSSTARSVIPGAPATFTFNISGSSTSAAVNANPAGSIFKSLDDFKNEVVKGGKKLAKFIVTVADAISHEIHSIEGDIYRFTITCLEDAVTAISGLFNTVFKEIMKAVEFLSSLFNWTAIVQNHEAILANINQLTTNVKNYINNSAGRLETMVQGWVDSADTFVDQITNQYGGTTIQSAQSNGSDPKQIYGSNGGYAQSKSFHSKLKDNARSGSTPAAPSTTDPQAFFSQIKDMIDNQLPSKLSSIEDDLKQAVSKFITGFKEIFTNPMGFVTSEFSGLLDLFAALAKLLINALGLTIELLIQLIADVLDSIVDLLSGEFQIPILSDLFKLIFGRNMSLLDLAAWAIAVPATIAQEAMSHSSAGLLGGTVQNFFGGISMAVGGAIDAFNDDINGDPASPLNWIDLAVGVLTAGLQFPPDADFKNDAQIAYYSLGLVPLILSAANAVNATFVNPLPRATEQQESVDGFNVNVYNCTSGCGLALSLFTIMGAALGNSAFGPKQVKENFTANVALMTKLFEFSARPVTVLADGVCPLAVLMIEILD